MSDSILDRIEAAAKAATPGPYYVATDDAEDAPEHTDSGLALVETGRMHDWPIARLCEWGQAKFTAECTPERIIALCEVVRAASAAIDDDMLDDAREYPCIESLRATLTRLEANK